MRRANACSSFSLGLLPNAPLRRVRRRQQNRKNHHRTTTTIKMSVMTTEQDAFEDAMKRFGIRSQIRLMTVGEKKDDEMRYGLFANGNVGWKEPGVLLEVPLDVCIVAPIGDDDDDEAEKSADDKEWKGGHTKKKKRRKMRVFVCALFFVAVFLPQIVRAFELVVFGNDFDALKRLQKHQHHGLSNRDEAMGTSLGSESAEEEEDEDEEDEEEAEIASPPA